LPESEIAWRLFGTDDVDSTAVYLSIHDHILFYDRNVYAAVRPAVRHSTPNPFLALTTKIRGLRVPGHDVVDRADLRLIKIDRAA